MQPITPETISSSIAELAQPMLEEQGLELFDVEFFNASGWILRISIDKPGGVSLDDCERVSVELGHLLDVEDLISRRYTLEVSSPGVNRKLRHSEDYRQYAGRLARVRTREVLLNTRLHIGYLERVEGDMLILRERDRGIDIEIPLELIEKAHLEFEWE
ncbi:ribosome maturation factor RimP [Desulfurispira natronophila]|uniref:Ribosome maturation factor RimP n=1 Tax=Desulfurispira natronophila TaxID=682562 RepID=A0A7W7Y5P1_9BACT|nr:ribosome maturation factor RimP [Desulfurispira natronophila]MBB5022573.1 ribosome maturation factor RimP [Desulfurispira natronophila]